MSARRKSPDQRRINRSLSQIQEAMQDLESVLGLRAREDVPAGTAVQEGLVRQVIRARERRAELLGRSFSSGPAWHLLLELFASALAGRSLAIQELSDASKVSLSTTLRWLADLQQAGLVERHVDTIDRRRSSVRLTYRAHKVMTDYFAEWQSWKAGKSE